MYIWSTIKIFDSISWFYEIYDYYILNIIFSLLMFVLAVSIVFLVTFFMLKEKIKKLQTHLDNVEYSLRVKNKEYNELNREYINLLRDNKSFVTSECQNISIEEQVKMEKEINSEKILSKEEIESRIHKGSIDPEGDLNKLIGLENIKEELLNVIADFEFDKERLVDGIQTENKRGSHMIFLGAPGTGKTTIAGIMTGILYKYGYIKENRFVDISALDLTGQYLGWTKDKTKKYIEAARGGVLFLDEVYALGGYGSGSEYSNEATSILVKEMEQNRDDFVLIVAGYKQPTLNWLKSNEGLQSRFVKTFNFKDYTVDECAEIFKIVAKSNSYDCSDEFITKYKQYIEMRKLNSYSDPVDAIGKRELLIRKIDKPLFGNARQVEKDYSMVKTYHSRKFKEKVYDDSLRDVFVAEDFQCLNNLLEEDYGMRYYTKEELTNMKSLI
jgi:stage V sporulation protein K